MLRDRERAIVHLLLGLRQADELSGLVWARPRSGTAERDLGRLALTADERRDLLLIAIASRDYTIPTRNLAIANKSRSASYSSPSDRIRQRI